MKDRLDTLLVKAGLAESKEQAQRLVLAGEVRVAGQRATKPASRASVDISPRPSYTGRGIPSPRDRFVGRRTREGRTDHEQGQRRPRL